jgi:hypothetical protein
MNKDTTILLLVVGLAVAAALAWYYHTHQTISVPVGTHVWGGAVPLQTLGS